jgi:uncharacterized protein
MTALRERSRGPIRATIARHPIATYVVVTFASTWALTGLLQVSILFGLLALFGPALGAFVASWADGSVMELRDRITTWRMSPRLYLLAIGIPFAISAGAALVWMLGGQNLPGLGSITAIEMVIFVLVIGEEIGWRGFLQPRLRARLSLPMAGLVTGITWTLWHVPLYLAPDQGLVAFAAFAWWVVPFAVVMAFVAERSRFSVLVATVMHGAANISIPILMPGVDRLWALTISGTLYLVLAVALVIHARVPSRRPAVARINSKEVAA